MARKPRQNQDSALTLALARGLSAVDAAAEAGCSSRTVFRRLNDPEFVQAVREARASLVERASAGLADAAVTAVSTLRSLLTAQSESVRLSASKSILELTCRFRDAAELEGRLTQLEEEMRDRLTEEIASGTTGEKPGRIARPA